MDIGQVKGVKGKSEQGKGKEQPRTRQDKGKEKASSETDDTDCAGGCGHCGKCGHTKAQCRKQKKDQ